MQVHISHHRAGRAVLAAFLLTVCAAGATAAEPFEAFLEALRTREMVDEALDYLHQMRGSTLISAEQKEMIPYEEGVTLVKAAVAERDFAIRDTKLNRATRKFEEFIEQNPEALLAPAAGSQLSGILVERARSLLQQAQRPANAPRKDALLKQSREMFSKAPDVVAMAEEQFLSRLKELDRDDPSAKLARQKLIETRLLAARIKFEAAQAYPDGDQQRRTLLEDAADKYKEVYDKYRQLVYGLVARKWQGRCYQQLGEAKKALGFYRELLDHPDEQLRDLQAETLELAIQVWIEPEQHDFDEAIDRGRQWIDGLRGPQAREAKMLPVYYATALALDAKAASDKASTAGEKRDLLSEALQLANHAAKHSNRRRADARRLAARLKAARGGGGQAVESFVDARDRGKESLENMQGRLNRIALAAQDEDQASVPKYQREADQFRDDALENFQLALRLRDTSTDVEEVNQVRYYLCFLYYRQGRFYEAAVLGDFLARNYPSSATARQSAKIAMASYLEEYNRAPEADRDFEADKMLDVAVYITERWPAQAEADEAWMILIDLAVRAGRFEDALRYLEKVPAESPRRGDAELKAGQALWSAYLAASRREEEDRPSREKLEQMSTQARQTLENGMQRMEKVERQLTYTRLASALSLAQIYVDSGDSARALELLTDETSGPLARVTADDLLTKRGNFRVETYKLALRAYVGAQDFAAAERMMNALSDEVEAQGDAQAAQRITRILIALGRELEDEIQRYRNENKTDQLEAVTQGFVKFLDKISSRESGNDFQSLNWVAGTFYSLASGLDGGRRDLPPQARQYYQKAVASYELILSRSASGKLDVPAESVTGIQMRLAACQRRLGRYKEAMALLLRILKENNRLLEAQKEAATTFQEWGGQNQRYLDYAIRGFRSKNSTSSIVWGWNELAIRVERYEKYADTFYDARYNLAVCRVKRGVQLQRAKDAAGGKRELDRAKNEILRRYRLDPEMGGPEWKKKFERVLVTIQKLSGEKGEVWPDLAVGRRNG